MTTVSPSGRGPFGAAGVPSRKSLPYVSRAAGHCFVSIFTSGAGGPMTRMVPSTLPVGPVYTGRCWGLSTASTSSLGIGDLSEASTSVAATALEDGAPLADGDAAAGDASPDGAGASFVPREHPAPPTKVATAPVHATSRFTTTRIVGVLPQRPVRVMRGKGIFDVRAQLEIDDARQDGSQQRAGPGRLEPCGDADERTADVRV